MVLESIISKILLSLANSLFSWASGLIRLEAKINKMHKDVEEDVENHKRVIEESKALPTVEERNAAVIDSARDLIKHYRL